MIPELLRRIPTSSPNPEHTQPGRHLIITIYLINQGLITISVPWFYSNKNHPGFNRRKRVAGVVVTFIVAIDEPGVRFPRNAFENLFLAFVDMRTWVWCDVCHINLFARTGLWEMFAAWEKTG
jgi:hypothetical protein